MEIRLIRSINVLHRGKSVLCVRHSAVIFAETPEEAIEQAEEQDLVGEWEHKGIRIGEISALDKFKMRISV